MSDTCQTQIALMKNFVKNFLTISLSVLVTLGLLEIGIRYLNSYMGHYPQKDPNLHHSLVPNAKLHTSNNEFDVTYQINSYGLRDYEYLLEKPKDVYRILMLGDSYTFGIGNNLEDTFSKVLERDLNKVGGKKIEVINGGCSSYSPLLEYLFLIYKGLALNPDLVILNYDISDVQDDYKYGQVAIRDSSGKALKVPPVDVQYYYREIKKGYKSKFAFLEKSELYQFVMKRYYQLSKKKDAPHFYEQAQIVAGDIEYDRDLPMREQSGDWKKHFENSAQNLKRIQELLKEKNIEFVITVYPYGNLLNEKEWAIGRKLRGFDAKKYSTPLFDYLQEFCQQAGIPFLNMKAAFEASKDFPLYYPYDGHFTPAGHQIVAQALKDFLLQQTWFPIH